MLANRRGIVKLPCAAGKTIVAALAIGEVARSADEVLRVLWVAGSRDLLEQGREAVALLPDNIRSRMHIDYTCPTGTSKIDLERVDLLLIDECHHAAAPTWRAVVEDCRNARIVWGLSATPEREDDLAPDVYRLIGPIVFEVSRQELEDDGYVVGGTVRLLPGPYDQNLEDEVEEDCQLCMDGLSEQWEYGKYWNSLISIGIIENTARNALVIAGAKHHVGQGDSVLVLASTIEHAKNLAGEIGSEADVIYGKLGKKKRTALLDSFREGTLKCLVAVKLGEEGLDVPRLNVLFLASAGKSRRLTEQRSGRALRQFAEKDCGIIYDFVDWSHPWLMSQTKRRMRHFKDLGYRCEPWDPTVWPGVEEMPPLPPSDMVSATPPKPSLPNLPEGPLPSSTSIPTTPMAPGPPVAPQVLPPVPSAPTAVPSVPPPAPLAARQSAATPTSNTYTGPLPPAPRGA